MLEILITIILGSSLGILLNSKFVGSSKFADFMLKIGNKIL